MPLWGPQLRTQLLPSIQLIYYLGTVLAPELGFKAADFLILPAQTGLSFLLQTTCLGIEGTDGWRHCSVPVISSSSPISWLSSCHWQMFWKLLRLSFQQHLFPSTTICCTKHPTPIVASHPVVTSEPRKALSAFSMTLKCSLQVTSSLLKPNKASPYSVPFSILHFDHPLFPESCLSVVPNTLPLSWLPPVHTGWLLLSLSTSEHGLSGAVFPGPLLFFHSIILFLEDDTAAPVPDTSYSHKNLPPSLSLSLPWVQNYKAIPLVEPIPALPSMVSHTVVPVQTLNFPFQTCSSACVCCFIGGHITLSTQGRKLRKSRLLLLFHPHSYYPIPHQNLSTSCLDFCHCFIIGLPACFPCHFRFLVTAVQRILPLYREYYLSGIKNTHHPQCHSLGWHPTLPHR